MQKKTLVNLAKVLLSLATVAILFYSMRNNYRQTLDDLWTEPKKWSLLSASWGLTFTAVLLTFVRWYFLVRALGLPFRVRDALRLGFLGYLFNFVSLGSVGGDLFKAVCIAHEHRGRKAEAVSTIIVDRMMGLYGLLLIGTLVVLATGFGGTDAKATQLVNVTLIATAVTTVVIGLLLLPPGKVFQPFMDWLYRLPKIGPQVSKLMQAMGMYRAQRGVLLGTLVMTLVIHLLNVLSFYCIAQGLPGPAPGLIAHFLIIPLGLIASAVPLPLAAFGAFELVMKLLYKVVIDAAGPKGADPNLGLLVALGSRVIALTIAVVGIGFYIGGRREVAEVLHEAEELEAADAATS